MIGILSASHQGHIYQKGIWEVQIKTGPPIIN